MRILVCYFLVLISLGLKSSKNPGASSAKSQFVWTRLLKNGPWKKNYNFEMFSQNNVLWVFHPDGNWFSSDGVQWRKSTLPNAIHNLAFLDYIQFNNSIYGLGHLEGNIGKITWRSTIYRSTDFKKWQTVTRRSNLPERFFYHPFVFKEKLWIIGGENSNTQFADTWNSDDGIRWRKVKNFAPFGKRSESRVVSLHGKLFLLSNDVWSSTDALNWKLETPEIIKGVHVFGYAPMVMDGRIWLLGCNRNGQFTSKVLSSTDGKNWQEQDAPWSPRGGIAACVHKGKIYMTGGKYGGANPSQPDFEYSNDLWVLEKNDPSQVIRIYFEY